MTARIATTTKDLDALAEIARRGGSLGGGRENTRVTNRLLAKGLIAHTYDAARVYVTAAGRHVLDAEGRSWGADIIAELEAALPTPPYDDEDGDDEETLAAWDRTEAEMEADARDEEVMEMADLVARSKRRGSSGGVVRDVTVTITGRVFGDAVISTEDLLGQVDLLAVDGYEIQVWVDRVDVVSDVKR